MSVSSNGKPKKSDIGFTGGPPKPPKPAATGGGDESPERPKVIQIPDPVVVGDLAAALAIKPFKIIADLMELGLFQNIHGAVNFETAAKVALKYGCQATKVG